MHTAPAAATHAVLSRLGRPIRVAPLADWRALADMRSAASMSVGIYSVAEVSAEEATRAECQVEGLRAAVKVMAEWRAAV